VRYLDAGSLVIAGESLDTYWFLVLGALLREIEGLDELSELRG